MATEIKSPTFPESVIDGTVANWIKKEGDSVSQDEVIAEIETDKVVLEVVAPFDGQILKIHKNEGEVVNSSEKIADFDKVDLDKEHVEKTTEKVKDDKVTQSSSISEQQEKDISKKVNPAAKKLIKENSLDSGQINPTGKKGRVTKSDVINHMNSDEENKTIKTPPSISPRDDEERVPMSRLRTTIANRLVTVQQETAMLTTFNEVDMQPIKDLRQKYGAEFEAEHGTKLGFMGFFVSASVQALLKFPLVNASIDGTVPILVISNEIIIQESLDIVNWSLKSKENGVFELHDPENLLSFCDNDFKMNLDRYKYPTRYEGINPIHHRNENVKYLTLLNSKLKYSKFLSCDKINYLDYCIFPFVRQFRNVDHIWFENLNLSKLNYWYSLIVESREFNDIMKKYKVWESSDSPLITNFIT